MPGKRVRDADRVLGRGSCRTKRGSPLVCACLDPVKVDLHYDDSR